MKSKVKMLLATVGMSSIIGAALIFVPYGQESQACGFRGAGGEGYTPQQRSSGSNFQNSGMSKDKAVEIVARHIKRLNPDLRIGNVNDAGPVYEAEILSKDDDEILQIIGVYKRNGQLVVIN